MPHEILNYEKKHFLIKCCNCFLHWRRDKKFIHLKKSKVTSDYISMQHTNLTLDACPACGKEDNIKSCASHWKLWRAKKPLFRPYQTEIQCSLGSIATVRFNTVKAVKAQGTSAPYLVTTQTYPIFVHGEFSTSTLWNLNLDEHYVLDETKYVIKPFHVIVFCSDIILYKLENVQVKDRDPFVHINKITKVGTLSSASKFSANLAYLDPIWTKA